jgi:hypothetical protein
MNGCSLEASKAATSMDDCCFSLAQRSVYSIRVEVQKILAVVHCLPFKFSSCMIEVH